MEGYLQKIAYTQRVCGYWFRFRNKAKNMGFQYYCRNIFNPAVNPSGATGFLKKIMDKLIILTGYWPRTWHITDTLLGMMFRRDTNELDKMLADYQQITLIQSSNWDRQDIYLAWYAKKKKINAVLIPYTTDQLHVNGFLLTNYHAVCVQGKFEKKCAAFLHKVPASKIVELGSAWFKNYDTIIENIKNKNLNSNNKNSGQYKYILFAGNSYFPTTSEYRMLAHLETAMQQPGFENIKIIYRPSIATKEAQEKIRQRWGASNIIEIQFPQLGIIGMGATPSPTTGFKHDWETYVEQLQKADLLVMTFISSLAVDFAYLGKPVVTMVDDPSGCLEKSRFDLKLDDMGKQPGMEEMLILDDINDLIPLIQELLTNQDYALKLQAQVKKSWDSPEVDFKKTLLEVLGESPLSSS
ncbi:MAG: hypothetical protein NXI01_03565 [Gammaproteobacteria bacterium]|nr:hypothetical protein [Gammaproteobacteria bacterium]